VSSDLSSTTGTTGNRWARAGIVVLVAILFGTIAADGSAATKATRHHRHAARRHTTVKRHRKVRRHKKVARKHLPARHRHHGAATTPRSSATAQSVSVPTAATPSSGAGVVFFDRLDYHHVSGDSLQQEAQRNQVVVMYAWDGNLVATLHRYNPHLVVLVYQFIMYARADDPNGWMLCSSLPQAQAGNWFLRGSDGLPVAPAASPDSLGLDIGLPDYQHACADHATALARQFGFDGVFLDGVGAKPDYQFGNNVVIPKYPSLASWQAAMDSFLQTMVDTAHGRGLKVMGNIGAAVATPGLWNRWSAVLDGSMEESWTDAGMGTAQQLPWFQQKLDEAAWSEAHQKYVLLHSWNDGESGNTFGLASMLLTAGGYSSYSLSNSSYVDGVTHWFPEYDAARRLGAPAGAYVRLANGVYARRFANGIVLVNPTQSSQIGIGLRHLLGWGALTRELGQPGPDQRAHPAQRLNPRSLRGAPKASLSAPPRPPGRPRPHRRGRSCCSPSSAAPRRPGRRRCAPRNRARRRARTGARRHRGPSTGCTAQSPARPG